MSQLTIERGPRVTRPSFRTRGARPTTAASVVLHPLTTLGLAVMLALATALGCAAHIAGDELTHGGCPLFWPASMHEFHLLPRPLQITTAKLCETWVIFPLLAVGLGVAVWYATGHPLAIPQPSK